MGLYLTHRLVKLYYDEIGDESEFVTGGFFVYSSTELATNNPHLKLHLVFYIPVCSDVYSSSINVPEHFTVLTTLNPQGFLGHNISLLMSCYGLRRNT